MTRTGYLGRVLMVGVRARLFAANELCTVNATASPRYRSSDHSTGTPAGSVECLRSRGNGRGNAGPTDQRSGDRLRPPGNRAPRGRLRWSGNGHADLASGLAEEFTRVRPLYGPDPVLVLAAE